MNYKKTKELEPNMILASNLYDNCRRILLNANVILTNDLILIIKKSNYQSVCIYDDITKNPDKNVYQANQIIHKVSNDEAVTHNLEVIRNYDTITLEHSINVALLSTITGVGYNMSELELEKLSMASLLHDLGKTRIDNRIINKPDRLTEKEYKIAKQHAYFGYAHLSRDGIDADVKNAVLYHHENFDGTGYPDGLSGEEIPIFARIIHVADVYHAYLSKRPYKKAKTKEDAMAYISENANTMFDPNIVNAFLEVLENYIPESKHKSVRKNSEDFVGLGEESLACSAAL